MTITFDDFAKVDIRSGTIVRAEPFPEARKPAYKVWVDFGDEIGVKKSSAQITENYERLKLEGKKVAGVVNFPPKQIGPFVSEFLLVGFPDAQGFVELITTAESVPNGQKLF